MFNYLSVAVEEAYHILTTILQYTLLLIKTLLKFTKSGQKNSIE